jgi:hypothetical protein
MPVAEVQASRNCRAVLLIFAGSDGESHVRSLVMLLAGAFALLSAPAHAITFFGSYTVSAKAGEVGVLASGGVVSATSSRFLVFPLLNVGDTYATRLFDIYGEGDVGADRCDTGFERRCADPLTVNFALTANADALGGTLSGTTRGNCTESFLFGGCSFVGFYEKQWMELAWDGVPQGGVAQKLFSFGDGGLLKLTVTTPSGVHFGDSEFSHELNNIPTTVNGTFTLLALPRIPPPPPPVPEPATWALMIAGLAIAGGALRRQRQRSHTAGDRGIPADGAFSVVYLKERKAGPPSDGEPRSAAGAFLRHADARVSTAAISGVRGQSGRGTSRRA